MGTLFNKSIDKANSSNSQPNFITTVNQLNAFDMIYIYHHIQEGTDLELFQEEQHLNGDLVYKVMYKTYHLGFVRISNFLKHEYASIELMHAKVFSLSKEKYLPTKSLDISIEPNKMKLVS